MFGLAARVVNGPLLRLTASEPAAPPMPVQIVMEQARARHFVWLRRVIETSLGLVLVFVGWAALFALAAIIVAATQQGSSGGSSGHSGGTVAAAAGVLAVVVLVGMIVGRRLIGRSRRLVLLLRRFGYTEATQALTFAALRTIGRSWRLVTLDDAAVAPVGVSEGTAKVAAIGDFGSKWIQRTLGLFNAIAMNAFRLGVAGMGAVIGYTVLHHRSVLTMVSHALQGHHSNPHSPAAIFAICFYVTMGAAAAVGLLAFAMLAATLLFQPWHLFSSALREAERAKVTTVVNIPAAHRAAHALRGQARQIFSPRLMVLQVDNAVWRPTVTTIADVASIVVIDVSEPTENLLWEISEVERDPETACVLVGNADRLRALESSEKPLERRLVTLLDGQTVLGYETSDRGLRCFGRALRATLELAVA